MHIGTGGYNLNYEGTKENTEKAENVCRHNSPACPEKNKH